MTQTKDRMAEGISEQRSRLERITRIAREAGALLLEGYRSSFEIAHKGRVDLVTDYDLRSEAFIKESMNRDFPGEELIAEESATTPQNSERWYIDPLDGTTNFAHGHPFFCVAIGHASKGQAQLGVVAAPALGKVWQGIARQGSWLNTAPIQVSTTKTLSKALLATGFPYDRGSCPDNNLREFNRLCPQVQGLRRCGSAAMDLCMVADGSYDGYWEQKLSPWDVCAGWAIAQGAGALISDYKGEPYTVTTPHLIAACPPLHPILTEEIQAARQ